MNFELTSEQQQIRRTIQEICSKYPGEYWRELDSIKGYPTDFVDE